MFASLQSSLGNHVSTTYNLARRTMPPACINGHASERLSWVFRDLPASAHHSFRTLSLAYVHALLAHARGVPRRCVSLQHGPPHHVFPRYVTAVLCFRLFCSSCFESRFLQSFSLRAAYLLHVDRPKLHAHFVGTSMQFVHVCEHSFHTSPRLVCYRHDASHASHKRVDFRAA